MSAICQYCGIAIGQVKRFEMKMARRFPEQEKLEAAGISAGKRERRGVRQMRLKREARETKAHGGLRVFPCPIGTKERALTWGARFPGKDKCSGHSSTSIAVARTRLNRQIEQPFVHELESDRSLLRKGAHDGDTSTGARDIVGRVLLVFRPARCRRRVAGKAGCADSRTGD